MFTPNASNRLMVVLFMENGCFFGINTPSLPVCYTTQFIFFFACKNYSEARNNLFHQLFLLDLVNIDYKIIIMQRCVFAFSDQYKYFSAVHQFTEESNRFT